MLRAGVIFICAVMLASCAHQRINDPGHPAVAATAQFIIQALAPGESENYRWDAFVERVSGASQWRAPEPGARDGENRREGRLSTHAAIIAIGEGEDVRTLSIETDSFHALALLEALRRAGAEVSFQADYESYSEYIVTPPGRDFGLLTTNSTCIPFDPQPGEVCRNYVTLTFNPY